MTVDERFERTLPTVLTDLYLGPTPDYRDDLLWQTARTRQRPAWSFPGRWLPMADLVTERVTAPRIPLRMIALALLVIALVVAGTLAFIGSQQPKLPPPFGVAHNGLIALDQGGDIVTLDPTTAATRVLVSGPGIDSAPVYSSDGTKIAFRRDPASGDVRSADRALYVVNADGSGLVRVTPDPVDDLLDWTFSPDGRALLVTAMVGGAPRVFEVASDGSRPPRTLDVQLPPSANDVEPPRYRPTDSSQVLVTEWPVGAASRSIAVLDLDTGAHRTLIPPSSTYDVYGATWSPNGEFISYGKFDPTSDTLTSRVHVVAADGTGDHLIDPTPGTAHVSPGFWSNDSTRMIVDRGYAPDFSNDRTAVVSTDGTSGSVELACPAIGGGTCGDGWSWSPDDGSLLGGLDLDQASARYLLADPATGRVTEVPWSASGAGSWQRVGP